MSKSKIEISNVLAGLIMIVGTKAVAQSYYVRSHTLEQILDAKTIAELVRWQVLLPNSTSDRFQYNSSQVIALLDNSSDPEADAFMSWLRTEVEKESIVNLRNSSEMQISTQDRDPRQKQ